MAHYSPNPPYIGLVQGAAASASASSSSQFYATSNTHYHAQPQQHYGQQPHYGPDAQLDGYRHAIYSAYSSSAGTDSNPSAYHSSPYHSQYHSPHSISPSNPTGNAQQVHSHGYPGSTVTTHHQYPATTSSTHSYHHIPYSHSNTQTTHGPTSPAMVLSSAQPQPTTHGNVHTMGELGSHAVRRGSIHNHWTTRSQDSSTTAYPVHDRMTGYYRESERRPSISYQGTHTGIPRSTYSGPQSTSYNYNGTSAASVYNSTVNSYDARYTNRSTQSYTTSYNLASTSSSAYTNASNMHGHHPYIDSTKYRNPASEPKRLPGLQEVVGEDIYGTILKRRSQPAISTNISKLKTTTDSHSFSSTQQPYTSSIVKSSPRLFSSQYQSQSTTSTHNRSNSSTPAITVPSKPLVLTTSLSTSSLSENVLGGTKRKSRPKKRTLSDGDVKGMFDSSESAIVYSYRDGSIACPSKPTSTIVASEPPRNNRDSTNTSTRTSPTMPALSSKEEQDKEENASETSTTTSSSGSQSIEAISSTDPTSNDSVKVTSGVLTGKPKRTRTSRSKTNDIITATTTTQEPQPKRRRTRSAKSTPVTDLEVHRAEDSMVEQRNRDLETAELLLSFSTSQRTQ